MYIFRNLIYWFNAYLTICLYQQFYLRSAACAIWGTPGHHSQSAFIYVHDSSTQLKVVLYYLFADDTKCLHATKTNDDFIATQEDLNVDVA